MLAYVFWHLPAPETDRTAYEEGLRRFHEALDAAPPGGFRRSFALRAEELPWLPGGPGYEDWYVIDASWALDTLNEAAVDAHRRAAHDAVAVQAAEGAGGLYRLRAGEPDVAGGWAAWFAKPAGTSYEELFGLLEPAAKAAALWQRQMVLGPAPEFCLLSPAPRALPGGLVTQAGPRTQIWPSGEPHQGRGSTLSGIKRSPTP